MFFCVVYVDTSAGIARESSLFVWRLSRQAVIETLSVGATMLLPPLRERMELLHSLLPQGPDRWESLSKGQVPDTQRGS